MGLDMYLKGKMFVGKHFQNNGNYDKIKEFPCLQNVPMEENSFFYIYFNLMYWRKSNAIHNWFVVNIQDGNDDCGEYSIEKEDLEKLLKTLKKVKDNPEKADKILPTKDGCFFGSVSYDEEYFGDIKDSIVILENILNHKLDNIEIYYQSSW